MNKDYSPTQDMPDFAEWVACNRRSFGYLDYIHAQVQQGRITSDVLGAIVGWLWPEFMEVDGFIILASKVATLDGLRSQDVPDDELEYWCNFTNIDGALPGMTIPFTAHLAGVVRDMWRAKLQREFPGRVFSVEIIELRDQHEVSVTFRQIRP